MKREGTRERVIERVTLYSSRNALFYSKLNLYATECKLTFKLLRKVLLDKKGGIFFVIWLTFAEDAIYEHLADIAVTYFKIEAKMMYFG